MRYRIAELALAAGALVALAAPATAQNYFGQNQVQYDHFDWHVLETEHFLIHYYPQEREAAMDAARMAERSYARLSRIFDHQFREKKPMILFASRADFGQNTVFGDLGEATQGVTDAQRHRMMLNFTGNYRDFEHVMTHEMTHEFQYDIIARGRAGAGLQTLAQINPPLWFMEGMAEYLSLGPDDPETDTWMRDAALNGHLPTIEDMTERPDRFFPYRYGHALWTYIGQRWGDETIGEIMNDAPNVGIERAIKRETGMSLDDLSDEWKEAMQVKYLPAVATMDRARKFAQPLLTSRRSGGEIFLGPALSSDGKRIAFLSNGSFLRAQVFVDLWLADATTGKRIKRLVKSTLDPNFEELQLVYSQSSFSPDGKLLAFTAQRDGKDALYILDVKHQKTIRRFDLPLETVVGPSWSPDGRQLVFSGGNGGLSDLYTVSADGSNLRQLTKDRYGDMQPQWSPDGKTIAFATDRGPDTDLAILKMGKMRIATLDLATGQITVLPGQDGENINPQWAPDGKSLIYVSDRTGTPNLFLYDFGAHDHYELTNVVGAIYAITETSPVISWARQADRLAITYYEDGQYTIWSIDNPRTLKHAPYRAPSPAVVATAAGVAHPALAAADSAAADTSAHEGSGGGGGHQSFYRSPSGFRASADLPSTDAAPKGAVTITALLDSADMALPDTTKFKDYRYRVRFQADYVAQPTVGYAQDNYGRGLFGGTAIYMSDLLGGHQLAFSGQVNGRLSEAMVYGAYADLTHRFQWQSSFLQYPWYFLSGDNLVQTSDPNVIRENQDITRFIVRQVGGVGIYPLNRFNRLELGAQLVSVDSSTWHIHRDIFNQGLYASGFYDDGITHGRSMNYVMPYLAYVSDNTLFGYTGPIFGHRYRFQVEPTLGSVHWVEYTGDWRLYYPLLFNYLTFASRVMSSVAIGPDERYSPKYIGRPDFVRGYDRTSYFSYSCITPLSDASYGCSASELLGSRVALANAELRFPVIRRLDLGLLPIMLPPLDGAVFYDAGIAWNRGQTISLKRPEGYNQSTNRYVLRSYGVGLRLNLFNYAIVRWDYAIPLDRPERKGFWTWSIGPSF